MNTPSQGAGLELLGRIAFHARLHARSGLAIGSNEPLAAIAGIDSSVIRDPLSREPYIPGSSLKGKMRSLTERALGLRLREAEGSGEARRQRSFHQCGRSEEYHGASVIDGYSGCPVCHLYGASAKSFPVLPTRLLTRDAFFEGETRAALARRSTELPFTEVKTESLVDRISASSTPRHSERVPGGAVFEASWMLSLYSRGGADLRDHLLIGVFLAGLALLEDDYLGGQGSRGYGRIEFAGIRAVLSLDRGLSPEALQQIEGLREAGTSAAALGVTGNPLSRK